MSLAQHTAMYGKSNAVFQATVDVRCGGDFGSCNEAAMPWLAD